MAILCRNFYTGNTVDIARSLVDCYLVRRYEGQLLVCRITETEAYVGAIDKAAHSYGYHKTARNATMFGPPGHAYLYLIYGMHYCLNLVTEPEGEAAAVLIRGLEAVSGTETIRRLRFGPAAEGGLSAYQKKNFLNGPGKLCRALALTTAENGMDLTGDTLFLCERSEDVGVPSPPRRRERVRTGPRIGVDYAEEARDFPWRFWLETED